MALVLADEVAIRPDYAARDCSGRRAADEDCEPEMSLEQIEAAVYGSTQSHEQSNDWSPSVHTAAAAAEEWRQHKASSMKSTVMRTL